MVIPTETWAAQFVPTIHPAASTNNSKLRNFVSISTFRFHVSNIHTTMGQTPGWQPPPGRLFRRSGGEEDPKIGCNRFLLPMP